MEADKTVLDRAAVIEVSCRDLFYYLQADNRPPSNAFHQYVQPISKLQRSKLESHQRRLMNLEKMGKSVDRDCLGRWQRRRGMNGLLGSERRIRCSSRVTIEDMHVSRMILIGFDEGQGGD